MREHKLIELLFFVMLAALLSISTMATYYGLKPTLGSFSFLGTVGIVIALFGSTTMIHWLRKSSPDSSIAGPVAMLCFALIVSTAANVTYFYTAYLERDLSHSALQTALKNFKTDIEDAKKTLDADEKLAAVTSFKTDIKRSLDNLHEQLLDPLNKGLGTKSLSIMADIKHRLPSSTEPALPTSRKQDDLQAWYDRYARLVNENAAAAISDQQKEYLRLKEQMDADYVAYANASETVKPEETAALIRKQMETMGRKLVQYQGSVNRLLSHSSWSPPQPIDPDANWIGDIARTWGSVLKGEGDMRVFIWSLVASLIVDLFPLLYSLLVVKRPVSDEFHDLVVT